MTLADIEKAVRKNCIMAKDPGSKPLETDYVAEMSHEVGLIVFLGIARRQGFLPKEISDHMNITIKRYNTLLAQYQSATRTYSDLPIRQLYQNMNVEKKIVIKLGLVSNALSIGQQKSQIFTGFPDADF